MTILFYTSCILVGFVIGRMVAKHQAKRRERNYISDTDDLEDAIRQHRYDYKRDASNLVDVVQNRFSQKPSQFTHSFDSSSSSSSCDSSSFSSYDSGGSCGGSDGGGCGGGD